MTAHRSLNKLERRAHMNMHVTKDMEEVHPLEEGATRDRFGKKHTVHRKEEK